MRLNEILTEDQELQEGPLLNKIGTGIGNVVGGVAKAAGAVAGGIAGLGAAAKKGFQAGKQTVAGAGDEPAAGGNTAAPAATGGGGGAPAPASSTGAQTQTLANPKDPNTGTTPAAAGGPPKSNTPFGRLTQAAAGQDPDAPDQPAGQEKPTDGAAAQPQATAEKPAAGAAPAAQSPAPDDNMARPTSSTFKGTASVSVPNKDSAPAEQPAANDAAFQKVQQNIGKLPPEQQKELMAALMADPEVKKALEQPAPAADAEKQPAAGAAAQPETPAAAPAAANQAAAKPARQRDAQGRFIGKNAPRTEPPPSQAEIDADRARLGVGGSESITNKGKALSENLASHVKTMQAMNRGFQRGLSNPFAGPRAADDDTETSVTASTKIVDKSGTMPVQLIDRVNSLDSAGKQQLFKILKARQ